MSLPWWVLVVDDDAEVNALIVEMLRDEGFIAHGLTQAHAAMALFESASPPGFIIADMTMPDIDGIDLVARAERHGIKGMLITAADPRRLKTELTGRPMPVMRKPFEVDELIRLVARYRPSSTPACAPEKSGPITCSV
jgi:CheY-like chemotaxis protein